VYRQIGGHAYGHTYPGPIGILLTAMLEGRRTVRDLAHASSLCGACLEVCPVRIDIPRMLIELRATLDRDRIAPWTERVVFKILGRLIGTPSAFRLAGRLGRVLGRPFVGRDGRLRSLPLVFRGWTAHRDLPPVAPRSFMDRWREQLGREDRA
jgi:L-lactate dehydrogenase complex protein LldF